MYWHGGKKFEKARRMSGLFAVLSLRLRAQRPRPRSEKPLMAGELVITKIKGLSIETRQQ
jgi:hypothetical protein